VPLEAKDIAAKDNGERPMANEKNDSNKVRPRGGLSSSLAALGGVIVASSCCLPVLPFVVAGGLAGISPVFAALQPYLLAGSILLVAFGFYQSWRAKKCDLRVGRWSRAVLWFSAAVVFAFVFFPQVLANFLANVLAR
jgi:hypothetical protein